MLTLLEWVTLVLQEEGVVEEDITNPEMCLTWVDLETGVLDGRFVQDKEMVLGWTVEGWFGHLDQGRRWRQGDPLPGAADSCCGA